MYDAYDYLCLEGLGRTLTFGTAMLLEEWNKILRSAREFPEIKRIVLVAVIPLMWDPAVLTSAARD